jgi:hypothetical protein
MKLRRARGLSLNEVVREILIAGRPKTVPSGIAEDAESLRKQYEVLREAIASEEHGFLDAKAIEAEIAARKGFRGETL